MDTPCKKLLWLALMLVISTSVTAQEEVSKKINRSYALTHSGEFQIENKYGNIHLNGWQKEEVMVEVTILVNHRKKEKASELLQRINLVEREVNDLVSVQYEIKESNGGFWSKLFDEPILSDYNQSNIQIDFTVHLPAQAKLIVANTFGDVIIDDWKGNLKATIEHGDLWLNTDLNKVNVFMKYGKIRANNLNYASISLKNGKLDMEDSKSLRLNSSGSDLKMKRLSSLELDSNKDELSIEAAGTLFGSLKFSSLVLKELNIEADVDLKISDFGVEKVLNAEAQISIEQESSEISIHVKDFSHQFKATIEQGLVRLPKSFKNIDSKMLDKGKKLRVIKANYGKNQKGNISITGKKGIVLIKE